MTSPRASGHEPLNALKAKAASETPTKVMVTSFTVTSICKALVQRDNIRPIDGEAAYDSKREVSMGWHSLRIAASASEVAINEKLERIKMRIDNELSLSKRISHPY